MSRHDKNPPTPEEADAVAKVLAALSELTAEGKARVLKTAAAFYGTGSGCRTRGDN